MRRGWRAVWGGAQEACPELSHRVCFSGPVLKAHTAGIVLDSVCKRIAFRLPVCLG